MRTRLLGLFAVSLLVVPGVAQKRAAAVKEASFADAVAAATKAFDAKEYGAAITALQNAIRAVQKLQRVAILAALPQPAGFTVRDDEAREDEGMPGFATMAALGLTVGRHYEHADKRIDTEVLANSPMVAMVAMMLANPALVQADGGEVVEYGKHKALLKKSGDTGHELTIVLFDKHLVKATCEGMTADDLLVVFDQATVDRLEKALGN